MSALLTHVRMEECVWKNYTVTIVHVQMVIPEQIVNVRRVSSLIDCTV